MQRSNLSVQAIVPARSKCSRSRRWRHGLLVGLLVGTAVQGSASTQGLASNSALVTCSSGELSAGMLILMPEDEPPSGRVRCAPRFAHW